MAATKGGARDLWPELLDGSYDCVDRLVLRAYFQMGQSPGGFRTWWRRWKGSDEGLDGARVMRMAGRFARRVQAGAEQQGIPLLHARPRERKDEIAERHLPKDPSSEGVFLIVVNRAPGQVWHLEHSEQGRIRHFEWKRPQPYVNHYASHIWDRQWGHVLIRFCPHPPFNALVLLNGHEYVAQEAGRRGLAFRKEGNCFTEISDAAGLGRIAETWSSSSSMGQLVQVCERWIYSAVLCFALEVAEQERTGFRYSYSVFQAEYSRNLLFPRDRQMERVFGELIDRTRGRLQIRTLRTLLGRKHRPYVRRRGKVAPSAEVVIERPRYDLTVFKVHFGRRTLKIYTKGERVLRIEALVHNARELPCGTGLDKFPPTVTELRRMVERFVKVLDSVDTSFVHAELLEQLPAPGQVGRMRVGGVDLNQARIRAVLEAVLALSAVPEGFTSSALADRVKGILADPTYHAARAAYDLRKLRAKGLVQKIPRSRRYRAERDGLRTMAPLLVLRDRVLQPLLSGSQRPELGLPPSHLVPLDQQYRLLHKEMTTLSEFVGIAA
jgi:hypothetical protein